MSLESLLAKNVAVLEIVESEGNTRLLKDVDMNTLSYILDKEEFEELMTTISYRYFYGTSYEEAVVKAKAWVNRYRKDWRGLKTGPKWEAKEGRLIASGKKEFYLITPLLLMF